MTRLELGLTHSKVLVLEEQLRLLHRILCKPNGDLTKDCLLHLHKFGPKEEKYNWQKQLKQSLKVSNAEALIDFLDVKYLKENFSRILEEHSKSLYSHDICRANRTSFCPYVYSGEEIGVWRTEKYFSLGLPKNILAKILYNMELKFCMLFS